MITGLGLENFKAWRKLDKIRMAPLTGFFGANSSGKSSIIQFLLLLKQTINFSDTAAILFFGDEGSPVELESYENIVFRHDLSRHISWTLAWQTGEYKETYSLMSELESYARNYPLVTKTECVIGSQTLKPQKEGNGRDYSIRMYRNGEDIALQSQPYDESKRLKFVLPVRLVDPTDAWRADKFQSAFESQMVSMRYLGSVRNSPKRYYQWDGGKPSDVGKMGERFVPALLASGEGERVLKERIGYWLKELKLIHGFKLEQIGGSNLYKVMVQRTPHSVFVPLPDVGFGVSQILPVLVLCFYAPEHSTIILEHPELHLHPSVQMGLADVLIEAIQTRHIQIILESHSEHLLNRIQRRMAEASLTKEEVALYFCDMEEDGAAKMEELKLNEYGEISNYPPDFFGNQFEEVAETQLAGLRRRKANK